MTNVNFDYSVIFKKTLSSKNEEKLNDLWAEYKSADSHNISEMSNITESIAGSSNVRFFENSSEDLIFLFKKVDDKSDDSMNLLNKISFVLKDGDPLLLNEIHEFVREKFAHSQKLSRAMELSGFLLGNTRDVITAINLIANIREGGFLYHKNGWGVGEILKIDFLRGELKVDFEGSDFPANISMSRMKNIVKLIHEDNFLVQRFSNPTGLEEQAKKDPENVIYKALKDIGTLRPQDVVILLRDVIIPEHNWSSWWVKANKSVKNSDKIVIGRDKKWSVSGTEKNEGGLHNKKDIEDLVVVKVNNPSIFGEYKNDAKKIIDDILQDEKKKPEEKMSAKMYGVFLEVLPASCIVDDADNMEVVLQAFGKLCKPQIKRFIVSAFKDVEDGKEFLKEIFVSPIAKNFRKEIESIMKADNSWDAFVENDLKALIQDSTMFPELKFWLILKRIKEDSQENSINHLNDMIKMINDIDSNQEHKAIFKKALVVLRKDGYKYIREAFACCKAKTARDFLTMCEQCHEVAIHDLRVIKSIALSIFPEELEFLKTKSVSKEDVVWTTRSGLQAAQDKANDIMSKKLIENAKEIKIAREYGDLRENAEYSAALDKRRELQICLNQLLNMIKKARCIPVDKVQTDRVSVGCEVLLQCEKGEEAKYIILGPWDIDVNKKIISYATNIAKELLGKKIGEAVKINEETFLVKEIKKSKLMN